MNVSRLPGFGNYHELQGKGRKRGNLFRFAARLATAFEHAHNFTYVPQPHEPDIQTLSKHLIAEVRLLAEAIILHEMVHWGDYKKDGAQGSINEGEFMSGEMGISFEQAAYGKATARPVRFKYLQEYCPYLWV